MISSSIAVTGIFAFTVISSLQSQEGQGIDMYPEKEFVLNWLDTPRIFEKYGKISDAIWSYAELGLQEFKSAELLTSTLEKEGFTVDRNLAGMPTCFTGSYGSGEPVIGILAEFDALPMISQQGREPAQVPVIEGAPGHGCGHNTMGTAAVASAVAVKRAMEKYDLNGTIKIFGSPAEEMLISRPYMVRAGLFDNVDAVIDNHFSKKFATSYGVGSSALFSVIFTFRGRTAHSAASPWGGRSALDAVEIMNVSTNYMREHLNIENRMHYVILEGGEAPNVVPDKASVWYFIRNTDHKVEEMYQRVVNCAKGAALATDTELSEIRILTAVHQKHQNRAAAELFQRNIELVGMPRWTAEEQDFARSLQKVLGLKENGFPGKPDSLKAPGNFVGGGSTDVGDVTLVAPTATIEFPGNVPGAMGHHWSTVSCTYGSAAWKGLNAGAKAMAASAIDLLTKPSELKKLRDEFEAYSKEHPYRSFLPDDAAPPLDINKEKMLRWRTRMESYYSE